MNLLRVLAKDGTHFELVTAFKNESNLSDAKDSPDVTIETVTSVMPINTTAHRDIGLVDMEVSKLAG